MIAALGVAPAIVAQWQVDHRVPGGISGMGSIRHVQSASRALPSEARFERMSSGLLPSENRVRYLDAGPGTSYARMAPPPGVGTYRPPDPYASMSSVRYGGTTRGTMPGPPPAAPIAPYPSAAAPLPKVGGSTRQLFADVPSSIRYSNPGAPLGSAPRPTEWGKTSAIAAPSPYSSPGSIRYSSQFP